MKVKYLQLKDLGTVSKKKKLTEFLKQIFQMY